MINPIRLKTATEAEMLTALREAGFAFNEYLDPITSEKYDELITSTKEYFLSMCGTLYKNTGVMLTDSEGNEYPEKLALTGFHANLVTNNGRMIQALKHITINVNNALIKIAGEK